MYCSHSKRASSDAPTTIKTARMTIAPSTPHRSTRRCCSVSSPSERNITQEDKEIVDAERAFDQVAGEELQRGLLALRL